MNDTPDPLDDLLWPKAAPGGPDPLRLALLRRTTALLRRRRRLKRLALAAAMAACYLAGVLSRGLLTPPRTENRQVVRRQSPPPSAKQGPPRPSQVPTQQRAAPKEDEDSALALEWRALEGKDRRFELYRRAGDLYLKENDVESALRCYRGALAAASARQRALSAKDSWLLMAVKQERPMEKAHAKVDS
jgi:hypothetical protein